MSYKTAQFYVPEGANTAYILENDATLLDIYPQFGGGNLGLAMLPNGQYVGEQKILRVFTYHDWPQYDQAISKIRIIPIAGVTFEGPAEYSAGTPVVNVQGMTVASYYKNKPTMVFLRWTGYSWIIEAGSHGGFDLDTGATLTPILFD